ncbi:MAG: DUF4249 domain-containing protein [Reichenbachiella sp.]|uniref:DUF4249 domain-containing protein n=1 Tax=Reichenbachiella sp. TaxID=2184521 RepID=UPI003267A7AE
MIRVRNHIILIAISLISLSCIDQINLNLESGTTNLVVFGWITNETRPYEVKLSLSNAYSDQSGYPPIIGAEVYVTDQLANRYDFMEIPNTGRYLSDPSDFIGRPGDVYQLTIIHEEKTYLSALETMPSLTQVEDAFVNFIADPADFEIDAGDENFFISAFVLDDPNEDNYYRWKIFVNSELRNQPEELVLFDDRFTNGNKFKYDAGNVVFTESDIPYFQHMSLSKGAYDFYLNLKEQTSSSTLSPRIQPGIISGNMINENDPNELVLGYFGASEVITVEIVQ